MSCPKPSEERRALMALVTEIRACRVCAAHLPHEPRPVVRVDERARIAVVGQAPGVRVHDAGVPFVDPSGDRLRDWMGLSEAEFYDPRQVAVVPMGFCFPGLNDKKADLPPRKECAPLWQQRVFDRLSDITLVLLVGGYGQKFHLDAAKRTLTETVAAWRDYAPRYIPLPHPSWRNNAWIKKHPWFEAELLPELKRRVRQSLEAA